MKAVKMDVMDWYNVIYALESKIKQAEKLEQKSLAECMIQAKLQIKEQIK